MPAEQAAKADKPSSDEKKTEKESVPDEPGDLEPSDDEENLVGVQLQDLSRFVNTVSIGAPTDDAGNYIIEKDKWYTMTVNYKEIFTLDEFTQFHDQQMNYRLPDGLTEFKDLTKEFNIDIQQDGQTFILAGNRYQAYADHIDVEFNTNDPNYERFQNTNNVNFNMTFEARFDDTGNNVHFGDNVDVNYMIDDSRDLSVSKTGQIDYETNIIYYTIEVRSTKGENTLVYVEDTVEGTALTLDQDSIKIVTSNGSIVAHRSSANYFNYSIYSLPDEGRDQQCCQCNQ